jgi:alpha-L-arabinofuranosidase
MKFKSSLIVSALCGMLASTVNAGDPGKLTVDATTPGPKIGPLFYGLMTEEINHAYDGGLYAELVQNRIFQDAEKPVCWSVVQTGSGAGTIEIDTANPVNTIALKRSLRLDISAVGPGETVGVANSGFWGIPALPNTKYHASFYAKAGNGFTGPLKIAIQSNDGKTTFATASTDPLTGDWKKYQLDLTTGDVPKSTANQFVLCGSSKGSVWFSLVSLFPPTYKNRANGNRVDIMEKLADLHPEFLRFPGGNFLEGDTIATRFNWKETIGPLEDRPGHMGCWSYHVSDGLGLLEFLDWCEDLKMQPLLAVYAGYSLKGEHVNPGPAMEPFVQEALEEIEYCTGDASTAWGKRRIADGHDDPFDIHYIEIGNEDWFDKSGSYDGRFAQVFDAIKKKYPKLLCIATAPVHSRRPDLYDDHGYPHDREMLRMVHKYDHPDPNRPKVFFGEWATQDGKPTPTMRAALDDAAWLTGLQRDADTVLLNCYAPLLVNVNKGAWQWPTNLIGYDAANSFGSPSFYAQSMFSANWGDTVLPTKVEPQALDLPPLPASHGGIGVGTWHTTAEYKDITVTQAGKTLFASDFNEGLKGWKPTKGSWEAKDGVLSQTDVKQEPHIVTGDGNWQDYTLDVKARKTAGNEGFLILFHALDKNNYLWFNVGGWGNTKSAIQQARDGSEAELISEYAPFTVEPDKWYDIRVECKGLGIKCYVDDKLICQATEAPAKPTEPIFAAASRVDSTGEVILKVVNVVGVPQQLEINLQGVPSISKDATIQTLQGDPWVQNSVDEPTKIAPKTGNIDDAGTKFVHEFPADSVTVIRLKP